MTEAARPKILLIKPILPYPPNQGTRVASFALIQALQSDFDVTVLARITSRDEENAAKELDKWCYRVVTVLAPNRRSLVHRLGFKIFYYIKSLLTRRSLKSLYDCPGAFIAEARRLSRDHYDLVIVEYWQLARMMSVFPLERCVLLTHDIDMFVNRQVALLERNLPQKISAVRRWLLEQKEEIAAYRGSKHVWALTERDKAAVTTLCGDSCTVNVMPFGVDVDAFAPSGMGRAGGEVLFLGHLGASFNRDALTFFAREIYPKLDGTEGMSISIVGGHLPRSLESFGLKGDVEVIGPVADVRPYLHRATCLVVPLRFGGGLRIRILEAMAAGIPIICTSVAIAGMPFEPEKDYLLADSPTDFAAAIQRLIADPDLRETLSSSAARKVGELYATEAQRTRLVELVSSMIDVKNPRI